MKDKIKKILQDYMLTDMPLNDATQQVLDLFAVSNNEVAVCDACGSERTIILKKCGQCGNTLDIIKAN